MLQYITAVPGVDSVNDILLMIEASSPNGLDRYRSLVTSPPQNARVLPTTARGHEAFIISNPTGQNHTVGVAWMETPSQFVGVQSSRVSVNQLRQMAKSFDPLSNDDWNTKVARNELLLNSATTTPAPTSTTTRNASRACRPSHRFRCYEMCCEQVFLDEMNVGFGGRRYANTCMLCAWERRIWRHG